MPDCLPALQAHRARAAAATATTATVAIAAAANTAAPRPASPAAVTAAAGASPPVPSMQHSPLRAAPKPRKRTAAGAAIPVTAADYISTFQAIDRHVPEAVAAFNGVFEDVSSSLDAVAAPVPTPEHSKLNHSFKLVFEGTPLCLGPAAVRCIHGEGPWSTRFQSRLAAKSCCRCCC